ncbi:MAG TPA: HlyD family efflux transporter periplasmic adaptor subunit [Flavobacterium sp.]
MLNLSENRAIIPAVENYTTLRFLHNRPHYKILNRIILCVSALAVLLLFMPWTQNISGRGSVTALKPGQRPQTIQTVISGQIEKWHVQEGEFVKKGDTILFLSEIKEEYFDPLLIENTKNQLQAKSMAMESYGGKAKSLRSQISAIEKERRLKEDMAVNKLRQSILKVRSDSIDFEAAKTVLRIVNTQYTRILQLQKEGLKSIADVEEKRLKLQEAEAKIITQENRVLAARNELINARIEISRIAAEYAEKSAKAGSDQFAAMSSQYDAEAQVNKLKNQYENYRIRNGKYYITAPQDGYVSRALQAGIGETVKEGTPVVSIMPARYDIAVETFVEPGDLPLLHKGTKMRLWFDGWPTIVFSGWPGMSYGTFGGEIVAIENFISPNGKYRILVAPDPSEAKWPKQLSIGTGVHSLALLDNVPVWFEIWRTLNGFPPNFYTKNPK